jgi:LysM repeat protein
MDAAVDKSVDHVGFNLLSDREIELRFLISFNTTVVAENAVDIITDAKLEDVDRSVIDNMPSMTIYVVSKGDSLWSIAKRYNTSIEDILEVNDIADPDVIYPGQKLVIINKR